jgi:RNA polymerase sigma factor (sigma-70 family)
MQSSRKALIERLYSMHGSALRAFFRRRIRAKTEAPDLTQEVYLRMLRIDDSEVIHNPEGYLYSVASNLVKERAVLDRRMSQATSGDAQLEKLLAELPLSEEVIDAEARARRLREVLLQLSPKCRAAIVMQYRHDMSYREIAEQLGISTNMVKKYLAQGLTLCRRRMERMK